MHVAPCSLLQSLKGEGKLGLFWGSQKRGSTEHMKGLPISCEVHNTADTFNGVWTLGSREGLDIEIGGDVSRDFIAMLMVMHQKSRGGGENEKRTTRPNRGHARGLKRKSIIWSL